MMHCRYFDITRKGNHSATLVGDACSLPSEICAQIDPPPIEKRRLRQISAYNVSTVIDSEKSSITTNIKSTTGFPTSYGWSAYVTPKSGKGGSKSDFFVFIARRYAIVVLAVIVCLSVRPSVRPSVCHKSELYKGG